MKNILKEIQKDIKKIGEDERYHYPPALIQINAPLALIQVEMGGQMAVLKKYEKMIKETRE